MCIYYVVLFVSVCQPVGLLNSHTKFSRSCSWRPSSFISVFKYSTDPGDSKASRTTGDTSDNLKHKKNTIGQTRRKLIFYLIHDIYTKHEKHSF